jgi:hypothetical protein
VVELRDATGLAAGAPVRCVTVTSAAVRSEQGDAALIARHAPIIEQRGDGRAARGSDAPLLLVPSIEQNRDGTRTIRYHLLLSNEDGGTPVRTLLGQYGRSIDYELAYEVVVDAAGNRVGARYQGPLHGTHAFDGTFEGDRPLLRIATNNNNFSANVHAAGSATRFADAPIAPIAGDEGLLRDAKVVRNQPWVLTVAGKELVREGKVVLDAAVAATVHDLHYVGDPRRYVYLQGVAGAKAGIVELQLASGARVTLHLAADAGSGDSGSTAIQLPAGVRASDVTAVIGAIRGAMLLGSDWSARTVAVTAPVRALAQRVARAAR